MEKAQAALVALFDLDGDGTVDCGEFLAQFFRLGGAAKGERGGLMTKQQPPGGGGGAAAAPGGEKLDALFQRMKEVAQVFHHPLYALNQGQREALQIRRQVAPSSRFFSRPATREAERRASSAPGAGRGATPLPAAAAAGPPLTQAQRFKRRLQLAKRTGVLDASSPAAAAAGGGGGGDDGEDAAAGGAGERSGLLLRAIPNSTFSVFNLTQLWLTNNELEELPPSIEMLSGLKTLCISGNFVKILPAEIGSLENLERFYASGNELTQLPTEFGYLSNMKELLLDRNYFKDFPLQIIFLRSLEVLGLSDNVLTCLHPGLKKLRLLTTLEVDGNAALEAAGAEAMLRSLGGGSALTRLGAAGTPLAAAAAPEGEAEGARARVVAALPGLSHIRWGPDTNTPYQPLKPPAPMEYVSSKKTEYDPLLGAAEEVFDVLASEMKHMLKMRAKTAATLAQQKNRRRKM